MAGTETTNCRLCGAPLDQDETRRALCGVCDEYAQVVALQSNKAMERIVGELQNGPTFRAASRRFH